MPPKWGSATSSSMPRRIGITNSPTYQGFGQGLSLSSFDQIDKLINTLRRGTVEFDEVMDVAAQLMAKTNQGFVQSLMRGPLDPSYRFAAAYQIPVARRTQKTYRGWYVRRITKGAWALSSHERGAFAVEFGLGGTPRPVLRRSGLETLKFIQFTSFGNRIMEGTFGKMRDNEGNFRTFAQRIKGSSLLATPGSMGYNSL